MTTPRPFPSPAWSFASRSVSTVLRSKRGAGALGALPERVFRAVLAGAMALAASGCTPEIGDSCILSTDCSTRGDRLCDTAQPGGYCTQFNCRKNSCPDENHCVLFDAAVPGCGYNDRTGPTGSRFARSFCVAHCTSNADCRAGYVCADPRLSPWRGLVLDDAQDARGCVVATTEAVPDASPPAPAPICSVAGPPVDPIDASAPVISTGTPAPPLVPEPDAGAGGADGG